MTSPHPLSERELIFSWQPVGALVDLDNTLYDYWGAAARALERFAAEMAEDFGVDAAEVCIRYRALPMLPEYEQIRSGMALRRIRFGRLLASFPQCHGADVDQYVERYGTCLLDEIEWFDGARAALMALAQRLPVLIVTESREDIARPIMSALGLGDDWRLLCSYAHSVTKRDGGTFRLALEWMGLPANKVAMIGDSWEMDILGAAQAGIRQVWQADEAVPLPEAPPAGFIGRADSFAVACRLLFPGMGKL
ncbi:MAG: dUMP phosphatase [Betaproteobacteria bacterium ADurb.Bin341]|nr:MAG: dUMP phosphatase [Betaproteobacteria bacterium ADurb.Bin341]